MPSMAVVVIPVQTAADYGYCDSRFRSTEGSGMAYLIFSLVSAVSLIALTALLCRLRTLFLSKSDLAQLARQSRELEKSATTGRH